MYRSMRIGIPTGPDGTRVRLVLACSARWFVVSPRNSAGSSRSRMQSSVVVDRTSSMQDAQIEQNVKSVESCPAVFAHAICRVSPRSGRAFLSRRRFHPHSSSIRPSDKRQIDLRRNLTTSTADRYRRKLPMIHAKHRANSSYPLTHELGEPGGTR